MDDDDDDRLLDNHDVIQPSNNHKSIESVREWFIWSYLNVIIGGVILGIIAIGCSFRTNKFKRRQNYAKANKWSHVTFIVNLLATLSGLTIFGYLVFLYFQNIPIQQKQMIKGNFSVSSIHPK